MTAHFKQNLLVFCPLALEFLLCLHGYMPFLGNLGTAEWIIIAVLVVVFFGSKKLTELGRGLGESGRELKRVRKEFHAAVKETTENDDEEIKEKKK